MRRMYVHKGPLLYVYSAVRKTQQEHNGGQLKKAAFFSTPNCPGESSRTDRGAAAYVDVQFVLRSAGGNLGLNARLAHLPNVYWEEGRGRKFSLPGKSS